MKPATLLLAAAIAFGCTPYESSDEDTSGTATIAGQPGPGPENPDPTKTGTTGGGVPERSGDDCACSQGGAPSMLGAFELFVLGAGAAFFARRRAGHQTSR